MRFTCPLVCVVCVAVGGVRVRARPASEARSASTGSPASTLRPCHCRCSPPALQLPVRHSPWTRGSVAMFARIARTARATARNNMHTRSSSSSSHAAPAPTPSASWQRRLAVLGVASIGAGALYSSVSSPSSPLPLPLSSLSLTAVSCSAGRPPPTLSHADVYQKLASKVEAITTVGRGVVKEYHVNQYAANPIIEDTFAVVPSVACPPGGLLLGVFDGHSGRDASRWCAEELLPYLQYYRYTNRTDALIHKRVFLEADHHFLEMALREKRMAAGLSGACLNVTHVQGRTVHTANAGDCRTIIGRRLRPSDSATPGAPAQFQAVEMTQDHQIDTHPLERERLLRDHPDEEDIIRKNRVKGRLQPTRGFGDGFYKRREFYSARTLSRPYAQWTPPYTTAEPDISQWELSDQDEFMIMASDGLFQDMHSQQVVDLVSEWLTLHSVEQKRMESVTSRITSSRSPLYTPNASTFLIRSALQHASEHAWGRRRKQNENLSAILQVGSDSKRNVHDDLTVLVVFFDHKAGFPKDGPPAPSAMGPPQPPTLAKALSLHIKTPHSATQTQLPPNNGIVPIRVPPIQGSQSAANVTVDTPLRSNL